MCIVVNTTEDKIVGGESTHIHAACLCVNSGPLQLLSLLRALLWIPTWLSLALYTGSSHNRRGNEPGDEARLSLYVSLNF